MNKGCSPAFISAMRSSGNERKEMDLKEKLCLLQWVLLMAHLFFAFFFFLPELAFLNVQWRKVTTQGCRTAATQPVFPGESLSVLHFCLQKEIVCFKIRKKITFLVIRSETSGLKHLMVQGFSGQSSQELLA